MRLLSTAITYSLLCFITSTSYAYDVGSRILATGGVTQVEGSAGSGIVPWAVLSG